MKEKFEKKVRKEEKKNKTPKPKTRTVRFIGVTSTSYCNAQRTSHDPEVTPLKHFFWTLPLCDCARTSPETYSNWNDRLFPSVFRRTKRPPSDRRIELANDLFKHSFIWLYYAKGMKKAISQWIPTDRRPSDAAGKRIEKELSPWFFLWDHNVKLNLERPFCFVKSLDISIILLHAIMDTFIVGKRSRA